LAEIKAQQKSVEVAKSAYLPTLNGSYTWSSFYNKVLGQPAPPIFQTKSKPTKTSN
jgi:outer membrane protein